jgi:putative aldouronate transport system permease protein
VVKKESIMASIWHDKSELTYQIVIWILVGILALTCIFPLLYVVGMSFASEKELVERNWMLIIPRQPILTAYRSIILQQNFFNALFISVSRTVLTTCFTVVFVLVASYALAEPELPGRKAVLLYIIITMMIGGGLIPSYLLMANLKLLNTFAVMVIPCLGYTYGILVVKTFIEEIPREIRDSADIDGAGDIKKLMAIVFPLTLPCLAAIALFTAVGQWNSWFDALVYIRKITLQPMSLFIRNLLVSVRTSGEVRLETTYELFARSSTESFRMASVVVAMLPILCVYPFLQKYFIHGVFTGAVKG